MKRVRLFALLLTLASAGLAGAQPPQQLASSFSGSNFEQPSSPPLNSVPAPLTLNPVPATNAAGATTPVPSCGCSPSGLPSLGQQPNVVSGHPWATMMPGYEHGSGCFQPGCQCCQQSSCSQSACYGGDPFACEMPDPVGRFFPQDGMLRIHGWFDSGLVLNTDSPASKFNGPYNSVARSNEIMFNQAYLIAEIPRTAGPDWSIGARLDLLYGADYLVAQSVGFETNQNGTTKWNSNPYYGLAIPQLFAEIGTDQFAIQAGHFYSVVGFEGVPANGNFFYSKSYSYQFGGPFTHWGALATFKPNYDWEFQLGPVNHWNTLSGESDTVQFLGKVKYTNEVRNFWSSFAIITGAEQNNPAQLPGINPDLANRVRYSFIVDQTSDAGWEYIFHHWLGAQNSGTNTGSTALWYGIDQYLYFALNDRWKVGGRSEWFRDEDGTRVGLTLPTNPNRAPLPGNYFSFTVGPNYTPSPNVTIRPEIRYDTYQGTSKPYSDGTRNYQVMFAADVIIRF